MELDDNTLYINILDDLSVASIVEQKMKQNYIQLCVKKELVKDVFFKLQDLGFATVQTKGIIAKYDIIRPIFKITLFIDDSNGTTLKRCYTLEANKNYHVSHFRNISFEVVKE